MKSILYFTVVFVALFSLQTSADVIEEFDTLCRFISKNDDIVDDFVACKTYEFPSKFNEIRAKCQMESTGVTGGDHLRAICLKTTEQKTEIIRKVTDCNRRYKNEMAGMSYQVKIGLRKSKDCIKKIIIKERILANNRPADIW